MRAETAPGSARRKVPKRIVLLRANCHKMWLIHSRARNFTRSSTRHPLSSWCSLPRRDAGARALVRLTVSAELLLLKSWTKPHHGYHSSVAGQRTTKGQPMLTRTLCALAAALTLAAVAP